MNREQRIKQLEEKVDEMINSLSKNVAEAEKGELKRIELHKQWVYFTSEAANIAKELSLDEVLKRQKEMMIGFLKMPPFMRATKLSPPSPLINCPYGEHLNCKLQRLHICPVCSKNPTAFCGGDWVIHPAEPTPIRIDQIINGQLLCDRGENSNRLSMYSAIECKKWEPRKGEKVIGLHKQQRKYSLIGVFNGRIGDPDMRYYLVGYSAYEEIIPFISMEQYDKIIKGE